MRLNCGNLRYLNKNYNKTYTSQIQKWIDEMMGLYGTRISYFVYDYQLGRHDYLYGEDRPAPFKDPVQMTMIVNVNNDSLMLSKFGLQTQSDFTAYVTYSAFADALDNKLARPKAGDLIRLDEFGFDRPLGPNGFPYYGGLSGDCLSADSGISEIIDGLSASGDCCFGEPTDTCDKDANSRSDDYTDALSALTANGNAEKFPFGPNIYEITQVKDEDIANNLNPMLGHYCWKIEAIRFDNSYQPNAPVENGSHMVNDSPYYGKLPFGTDFAEWGKRYHQTADKEEDRYWDHAKYKLDEVYGGYGFKPKEELQSHVTYDPKLDPYSDKYFYVYDHLPFYDLATVKTGDIKFFKLHVVDDELKLEPSDQPLSNARGKYYIKDSSPCKNPLYMFVYAIFVYDEGLAIQFVGDIPTIDDVIYTSIYMKNGDKTARMFILNGDLAFVSDVSKEEKEEVQENDEDVDDPSKKFGEETDNPIDNLVSKPNDPLAGIY